MILATASAKSSTTRLVGLGSILTALLLVPGCARLRSFREPGDRPAFGTDPVSGPVASSGRAGRPAGGGRDADRDGPTRPPTGPVLARQGSTPPGEPPEVTRGPDDRPLVALRPPESLPKAVTAPANPTAGDDTNPVKPLDSASASPRPPAEPQVARISTSQPKGLGLTDLLAGSRRHLAGITSYRVTMNLQERVGGALKPPEDVVLNIRRHPRAVRLEWPDGPSKGREVIYSADANGGLMHVHMANALIPQLKMPPDSPLAMQNSRHPITEAGYDTIIENMENEVRRQGAGDFSLGKIWYAGLDTPASLSKPCHKIVRVTQTKETWIVYLDPNNQLPVFVLATADNGDVLERFLFRDLSTDPADLATADAFNPDARWGPSRGLLRRLARTGSTEPNGTESR